METIQPQNVLILQSPWIMDRQIQQVEIIWEQKN